MLTATLTQIEQLLLVFFFALFVTPPLHGKPCAVGVPRFQKKIRRKTLLNLGECRCSDTTSKRIAQLVIGEIFSAELDRRASGF